MKTYRAFIKPFLNENRTPKTTLFQYYDLSAMKQIELIVDGIGIPRESLYEKFTGEIPKSDAEIEKILNWDGSAENPNQMVYDLPDEMNTGYKKDSEAGEDEKDGIEQVVFNSDTEQSLKDNWKDRKKKRKKIHQLEKIWIRKEQEKFFEIEKDILSAMNLMEGKITFKNKNKNDCEAVMNWYLDIESMDEQFEENDICVTADFVSDFSDYKISNSIKLIAEDTKESLFYQKIFELLRVEELSPEQIVKEVSRPEQGLEISRNQIYNYKELIKLYHFKKDEDKE
jgi:hypothetical protein